MKTTYKPSWLTPSLRLRKTRIQINGINRKYQIHAYIFWNRWIYSWKATFACLSILELILGYWSGLHNTYMWLYKCAPSIQRYKDTKVKTYFSQNHTGLHVKVYHHLFTKNRLNKSSKRHSLLVGSYYRFEAVLVLLRDDWSGYDGHASAPSPWYSTYQNWCVFGNQHCFIKVLWNCKTDISTIKQLQQIYRRVNSIILCASSSSFAVSVVKT